MRLVGADTGPLNYLILIGAIDLLASLFETVLVPEVVRAELRHRTAPAAVRAWADDPPIWLEVRPPQDAGCNAALSGLDDGERAALLLAQALRADLVLMDDRVAVTVARKEGFAVIGTLGILDLAARHGLIDLEDAFRRLKATNFRYRPEVLDAILARHRAGE